MTDDLTKMLRSASGEVLLRTFAALTHRLHVADRDGPVEQAADLRAERNIVEAEILRRMDA